MHQMLTPRRQNQRLRAAWLVRPGVRIDRGLLFHPVDQRVELKSLPCCDDVSLELFIRGAPEGADKGWLCSGGRKSIISGRRISSDGGVAKRGASLTCGRTCRTGSGS